MPVLLFWPVPAATIVGGYYLATTAKVIDAALALAIPTKTPAALYYPEAPSPIRRRACTRSAGRQGKVLSGVLLG